MSDRKRARWYLIDLNFHRGMLRFYFFQSALATGAILILLSIFYPMNKLVFAAAMGSSSFVVFATPHSRAATPRCVVGGHMLCLVIGILCHVLLANRLLPWLGASGNAVYIISAGVAVGLCIFLMVITDTEHAAAAGTAIGVVINNWDWDAMTTIIVGVLVLSLVRWMLRKHLRDLI